MKKSYKKIIGLTLCIIMCIGMLTSCGATSFSKAKKNAGAMAEKLVDKGYFSVVVDGAYIQDELDDDAPLSGVLCGVKTAVIAVDAPNYDNMAVILYCDSRANAEKTYNEFLESKNEDPDEFEGIVVKKSGKMVFAGTEQAWEDVTEGRIRDIILGTLATIVIAGAVAGAVVVALVVVVLIVLIISKISKKRMKAKLTKEITATLEAAAEEAPVEETAVEAPAEE